MPTPRITALVARRDALVAQLEGLDQIVIERGADLDETESATYTAAQAELDQVLAELPALVQREQDVQRSRELSASLGAATDRNRGQLVTTDPVVDGGGEEIYREASDAPNFFLDVFRSKAGDRDASERLNGHRRANFDLLRASASTDLGGLVVPKYLVDKYQPLAVARRTFLNTLLGTPAYGGNITSASAVIPVETTGPGMGAQSSQNTAFSTANWASTGLTINANTVGGYGDVSVQAIQLGQVRPDRLFQEMVNRYYADQERQALWGSGASGECEGVFLADGTQTVDGLYTATGFAEIYGLVQEAASKIEINDEREAMYVLMSPGRWRSLLSATDSDGRPLAGVTNSFPSNAGAYVDAGGQKWFGGMRAVVSSKVVKSGEDDTRMAVYNPEFAYFEESDPYTVTADTVSIHTGTIRYVTYGFMIWSPEVRVNSLCLINNLGVPDFPMSAVS